MKKTAKKQYGTYKGEVNKFTVPAIYPNDRYEKSKSAKPDDENIERSREWVQFTKL